jgi:hypothetical protein
MHQHHTSMNLITYMYVQASVSMVAPKHSSVNWQIYVWAGKSAVWNLLTSFVASFQSCVMIGTEVCTWFVGASFCLYHNSQTISNERRFMFERENALFWNQCVPSFADLYVVMETEVCTWLSTCTCKLLSLSPHANIYLKSADLCLSGKMYLFGKSHCSFSHDKLYSGCSKKGETLCKEFLNEVHELCEYSVRMHCMSF